MDDAERLRFRAWLAEDPERHDAFNVVKRLWSDLEEPAALLGASGWHREGPERRTQYRGLRWAAAAAACIALVAAGALWRDAGLIDRARADLATPPGEPREFILVDGSHAYLDGDSAVQVVIEGSDRRLVLLRGRVWLDVRHDPARPFTVGAGDVETRVLGTAFAVDLEPAATAVTVERGRVSVTSTSAAVEVAAGQQVWAQGGHVGPATAVEPETALAWRRGLIVLDQAPLSKVVDELARMQPGRVFIRDAGLRQLRLSGVFRADDPEAVIEAMQSALGLRILRLPGVATLIYR
ncbi:FecR family protein [Bosea sp. PAMC 26642]|uniref:FecR family protein n=1 Tax=Bosea sp. (strain PAMC 26642) TaxID=1792307 RepID=UPI000AFA33B9|nr:FecR domain-containing protein [Bosea sp. PAMC 26642]